MSDSEPKRDEASPGATEVGVEGSEEAETEFRPFDEIAEDFKPGPIKRVMGPDGLPVTIDGTEKSDIPPLSPKTLVCMADTRSFVVRDAWGAVAFSFPPEIVELASDGRWRIPIERLIVGLTDALLGLREKKGLAADKPMSIVDVRYLFMDRGSVGEFIGDYLLVEPIRPACKHYVRQKLAFDLNAQHKQYARLCSARRTTEGTFMTVKDTGVWACDMRDPYDLESSKELDDFDRMKAAEGAHREELPMFGWTLGGQEYEAALGIFSKPKGP